MSNDPSTTPGSGQRTYPGLAAFLASPAGRSVTTAELDHMRAVHERFVSVTGGFTPSADYWPAMLAALRKGIAAPIVEA